MLKLICGGILCLCSGYIGISIKSFYKKKLDIFTDMIFFIDMLINEITFLKTPIPQIVDKFNAFKKGEITKILEKYKLFLKNEISLAEVIKGGYLNGEDKLLISNFFTGLGKTMLENQINELKNYRSKFVLSELREEKIYKTYGMLAYKLGFLIGIVIMIIFA